MPRSRSHRRSATFLPSASMCASISRHTLATAAARGSRKRARRGRHLRQARNPPALRLPAAKKTPLARASVCVKGKTAGNKFLWTAPRIQTRRPRCGRAFARRATSFSFGCIAARAGKVRIGSSGHQFDHCVSLASHLQSSETQTKPLSVSRALIRCEISRAAAAKNL